MISIRSSYCQHSYAKEDTTSTCIYINAWYSNDNLKLEIKSLGPLHLEYKLFKVMMTPKDCQKSSQGKDEIELSNSKGIRD